MVQEIYSPIFHNVSSGTIPSRAELNVSVKTLELLDVLEVMRLTVIHVETLEVRRLPHARIWISPTLVSPHMDETCTTAICANSIM